MQPKGEYRWAHPHDWLEWKMRDANTSWLHYALGSLAGRVGGNDIQDLFQFDMDDDIPF